MIIPEMGAEEGRGMGAEEQSERLKRPEPLRVEPVRNWSTAFKKVGTDADTASGSDARARAETVRGGPVDETVADGVALGYQVVEDHIRQGRRIAEQLGATTREPARSAGEEVRDLAEKTLRFYGDMGSQVVRLLETVITNSDLVRDLLRRGDSSHGESDPGQGAFAGNTAAKVEIRASQPTRACVELKPTASAALVVQPLHSLNGDHPPITDVVVERSNPTDTPVLRIGVAPNQPAGLYSGVVLDPGRGEVVGTVSVTVDDTCGRL
jgi:hypothetical protein